MLLKSHPLPLSLLAGSALGCMLRQPLHTLWCLLGCFTVFCFRVTS